MNKEPNIRVGAVIIFNSTADKEQCQQWLDELAERKLIAPATAEEYDADLGGPVFYLP